MKRIFISSILLITTSSHASNPSSSETQAKKMVVLTVRTAADTFESTVYDGTPEALFVRNEGEATQSHSKSILNQNTGTTSDQSPSTPLLNAFLVAKEKFFAQRHVLPISTPDSKKRVAVVVTGQEVRLAWHTDEKGGRVLHQGTLEPVVSEVIRSSTKPQAPQN